MEFFVFFFFYCLLMYCHILFSNSTLWWLGIKMAVSSRCCSIEQRCSILLAGYSSSSPFPVLTALTGNVHSFQFYINLFSHLSGVNWTSCPLFQTFGICCPKFNSFMWKKGPSKKANWPLCEWRTTAWMMDWVPLWIWTRFIHCPL